MKSSFFIIVFFLSSYCFGQPLEITVNADGLAINGKDIPPAAVLKKYEKALKTSADRVVDDRYIFDELGFYLEGSFENPTIHRIGFRFNEIEGNEKEENEPLNLWRSRLKVGEYYVTFGSTLEQINTQMDEGTEIGSSGYIEGSIGDFRFSAKPDLMRWMGEHEHIILYFIIILP